MDRESRGDVGEIGNIGVKGKEGCRGGQRAAEGTEGHKGDRGPQRGQRAAEGTEGCRGGRGPYTAKKAIAKFRHINRMTQDQTIRLMESVSNRYVGLFRHILTPKSDFSDKFRHLSRTFLTCFT